MQRLEVRRAADVGDVTAVESLVAHLGDSDAERSLARHIEHLASTFDFDALRALADELLDQADLKVGLYGEASAKLGLYAEGTDALA